MNFVYPLMSTSSNKTGRVGVSTSVDIKKLLGSLFEHTHIGKEAPDSSPKDL
jgi:hypothetical protein